jgi:three-Cys-motif partner protein
MAKRRQKDVPDHSDEKWGYPEHTAAKHEILHRYLGAWLTILGRRNNGHQHKRLVLIDGFAGRGSYMEGQPGSPAIMFERAQQVANEGLVEKVVVRCSEPNDINYQHLKAVCDTLRHPRVTVHPTQETFEDIAQRFIAFAERETVSPPTFIMVDPYGVRGVRLDTLRRLLSFDRVEVFLTFMVRDPARFLESNYDDALTALFGGDSWRSCVDSDSRPECLMRTFQTVVRGDVAEYVLPYKVYEDERRVILYYLVHLTNNDLGMRVMKQKMLRRSGEMAFFPISLRPQDQLGFEVAEQAPYLTLQRHLMTAYAGETMRFVDLLNKDYPLGHIWVEGQYKAALRAMEASEPASVTIAREHPITPRGRRATRISDSDTLTFTGVVPLI